jgi:hypothetical protein
MSDIVFPLALVSFLGGLVLIPWALVLDVRNRARAGHRVAVKVFALGVFAMFVGMILAFCETPIRFALDRPALRQVTRTAKPLIHAIETFTARTGRAPEALDELVSADIPSIPATGWSKHPSFEYYRFQDGSWRLWVDTAEFFQWDEFVYDPQVTEPDDGSRIDRVGDWYYLHE